MLSRGRRGGRRLHRGNRTNEDAETHTHTHITQRVTAKMTIWQIKESVENMPKQLHLADVVNSTYTSLRSPGSVGTAPCLYTISLVCDGRQIAR